MKGRIKGRIEGSKTLDCMLDWLIRRKKKEVFGLRANSKEQFDVDCGSEVIRARKGYSLKYRI